VVTSVQKSELEELIEALPFAETAQDLASIVEGSPLKTVEDAIALQPDQPRRSQLTQWLENLNQPAEEVETQPFKVRSWQWLDNPVLLTVGTQIRVNIQKSSNEKVRELRADEHGVVGTIQIAEPERNLYTILCKDGQISYFKAEVLEVITDESYCFV
jgi:hypothetical protein